MSILIDNKIPKSLIIDNKTVAKIYINDKLAWSAEVWQLDMNGCIIGADGKYYQRFYTDRSEQYNPDIDLNSQWVTDTVSGSLNIDKNFDYYMSNSNYHVSSSYAQFKISWNGLDNITLLYRSYAENNYDYLVINGLDKPKFTSQPTYSTSGIIAHTRGAQSTTYKELNITCDRNEHFIWLCYIKDGSQDAHSDRAFVGVPNNLIHHVVEKEKQGAELRYEFIQSDDFIIPREGYIQYKYYKTYFSPNDQQSWTTDVYELGPEVPVTPITRDYLRFDATNGDLTVGFVNPTWFTNLEYSLGFDETWQTFDKDVIVRNNTSIYFRANGGAYIDTNKQFTTNNQCECHGNIMSLLGDDFENNTIITGNNCFSYLFKDCNITTAPTLPATTLTKYCYSAMFDGCTNLTTAPALPATNITSGCYQNMFYGCTSLINAPTLPATTLGDNCYQRMFFGCTSLVNAPELPANVLGNNCYNYMFCNCKSLVTAPELPATTLATSCYAGMFYGCSSLVTAPELPATRLANYCYNSMFIGCTNLEVSPKIYAETITNTTTMQIMFTECSKLKAIYFMGRYVSGTTEITTSIGNVWLNSTPNTSDCIFHKNPNWTGPTSRDNNTIPTNWQIVDWIDAV